MKRLFALFLLTWYSLTATGATQLVHYCQHSDSVHLNHNAEELTQKFLSEKNAEHGCCHPEVVEHATESHQCCAASVPASPVESEVINTDDCCVELTQEHSPYVPSDFAFSIALAPVSIVSHRANFDETFKTNPSASTGLNFSTGPPLYLLLQRWVFYG